MPTCIFPPQCAKCYADNPAARWSVGRSESTDNGRFVTYTDYSLDVPVCSACKAKLESLSRWVMRLGVAAGLVAVAAVLVAALAGSTLQARSLVMLFPALMAGAGALYATLWIGSSVTGLGFAQLRRYAHGGRRIASGLVALVSGAIVYALLPKHPLDDIGIWLFIAVPVGIAYVVAWYVLDYLVSEMVDFVWPHFRNPRYRADFDALNAESFTGPSGPMTEVRSSLRQFASDSARAALLGLIIIGTIGLAVTVVYFSRVR